MEEHIYSDFMHGILVHAKILLPFEMFDALDEWCFINRYLFQNLFKVTNALLASLKPIMSTTMF